MINRPSKEQIQPTGDMILVQPLEVSNETPGGLLMPINHNDPEGYGMIVAVGPGFHQNGVLVEPKVAAGDIVMLRTKRGLPIRVGNEHLLFMNERDFLAVIRKR